MESGGFEGEGEMARKVILEVEEGDPTETLGSFFTELLKRGNLDALLIPLFCVRM